ncbi:MAG: hypothetical protein JXR96_12230 [Deltaproteobacteria bacterium]|nr:hypothetical protein [Deltaproteobacteria bacterium]
MDRARGRGEGRIAAALLAGLLLSQAACIPIRMQSTWGPGPIPSGDELRFPSLEEEGFDMAFGGAMAFCLALVLGRVPLAVAGDDGALAVPLVGQFIHLDRYTRTMEGCSNFGILIPILGSAITAIEITGIVLFFVGMAEPDRTPPP